MARKDKEETKEQKVEDIPALTEDNKYIHEPARLMLMSYLYVVEEADFVFLKAQTGLSWGNLSSHMTSLENKGYVQITKHFKGKKPQTMAKLTEEGRIALRAYRQSIMQVLKKVPD